MVFETFSKSRLGAAAMSFSAEGESRTSVQIECDHTRRPQGHARSYQQLGLIVREALFETTLYD